MDGPGWGIGILQLSTATLLSQTLSDKWKCVWKSIYWFYLRETCKFYKSLSPMNLLLQPLSLAGSLDSWWSMFRKVEMLFACPDFSLSWEPGHNWSDTLLTMNVGMLENPMAGVLWKLSRKGQHTAASLPWPDLCALCSVLTQSIGSFFF